MLLRLEGEGKNKFGIGAKVTVYYNNTIAVQEQMPMRGFESTVDSRLLFGLGKTNKIDSVVVSWVGGRQSVLKNVQSNSRIVVKQGEAVMNGQLTVDNGQLYQTSANQKSDIHQIFTSATSNHGLNFIHKENNYVDFDRDRLIFQMLSTQGPHMAKGDVNKDGLDDIYICGASGQTGALYVQTKQGSFIKTNEARLAKDSLCEDTDALFFDCDNDGDEDLFVCSGGNEFSPNSTALISRLYINDGKGNFTKSPQVLPSPIIFESASCVKAADYDTDGDMDLFVGVRLKPMHYGDVCKSYILQNNGKGIFTDVTQSVAPALIQAGMVTDAAWLDYDKDGKQDLVVTGEYMPVRILHNDGKGKLEETTGNAGLEKTNGWWNRIAIADINNDGYADIVAANHGLNSRFKATEQKPVSMYVNDFAGNGTTQQIITCYNGDSAYPMLLRHDLVNVIPALKKKYLKYESYKDQTIEDIFTKEQLQTAVKLTANTMQSSVFINNKNGTFTTKALPSPAQLSPMYAIEVNDFDDDGNADIIIGGNFYESKPEAGIYDASYGLFLKGDGKGNFTALSAQQSGINIRGAVRDITMMNVGKEKCLIVAKNDDQIQILDIKK